MKTDKSSDKKSQQCQKRPLAPLNAEDKQPCEKKITKKSTPGNREAGIIQTRSRTRADKAIAAHVGWVALPLDIIEKIIAHAVRGDKKQDEPRCNWFAERVVKYGDVCSTWKRAIIFSRTIFQRGKIYHNLINNHGRESRSHITTRDYGTLTLVNEPALVPTKFIEEGYVSAVKGLKLAMVTPKYCKLPTSKIVKSIADRNSIECLCLEFWCDLSYTKQREVKSLVGRLTKADHFALRGMGRMADSCMWIGTQKQAKGLWDLMRLIVHSNSRAKTIKLKCNADPDLDWDFINETERLNVGSIAELTIINDGSFPIEVFSNLAEIGTIVHNSQLVDFWQMFNDDFNEL